MSQRGVVGARMEQAHEGEGRWRDGEVELSHQSIASKTGAGGWWEQRGEVELSHQSITSKTCRQHARDRD